RRRLEVVRGDQGDDAPRADAARSASREARRRLRQVPRRPDRGRRRPGAGLRLVGGRAVACRLRPLRAPRHRAAPVAPAAARASARRPLRLGLVAPHRLVRPDAGRRPLHRLEASARRGAETRGRKGAAGQRRPRRPPRDKRGRPGSRLRRAPRGGSGRPHREPRPWHPPAHAARERRHVRRGGARPAAGANLSRVSAIPIRLRGETLPTTTERLEKYNVQGPRYTSYPTAPEWTDSSPEGAEAACARANAKGSPVSLYVHLPFCDEQCWFCGCFMKIVPKPDRAGETRDEIEPYLADVHREIDILASRIDRSRPVKQVHW